MDLQCDGYVLDYFGAEDDGYTTEKLIEQGFYPRGTRVRLSRKRAGYDYQYDKAVEFLGFEEAYTVKWCRIGGWSSTYEFDEVSGGFNHVMFEKA